MKGKIPDIESLWTQQMQVSTHKKRHHGWKVSKRNFLFIILIKQINRANKTYRLHPLWFI
jgi:hypothetical protein